MEFVKWILGLLDDLHRVLCVIYSLLGVRYAIGVVDDKRLLVLGW